MVSGALLQLVTQTAWGDLDYLVIDMPPGTGDIQLTLAQKVPVAGSVIVTTPQDLALLDARKGVEMFRKVNIPVLGVVENMAVHICSNCGHAEHLFGEGGGEKLATNMGWNCWPHCHCRWLFVNRLTAASRRSRRTLMARSPWFTR